MPLAPTSLPSQPFVVRGHVFPTRIVMAPMATARADEQGQVTAPLCEYYRRRAAAGGIGAIVIEHAYVHPQGRLAPNQLSIASDYDVEGLAELALAIHAPEQNAVPETDGDAARQSGPSPAAPAAPLAIVQLSHAGSAALPADLRVGLVAPSALVHPGRKRSGNTGMVARALSCDEIAELVEAFAMAARRATKAGFDGVEIHAAHGYLLDQFYSPLTNTRSDRYGRDSVENRARFLCETVAAVRAAIGPDRLIAVRIGPCDYAPGGAVAEEGPEYAKLVEQAGADIIDVSGGIYNFSTHDARPPGFFKASSTLIRKAVEVPVLTAGGVRAPADVQWMLETGVCDLVGVGRALMRQPAWAAWALAKLG